MFIRMLVLKRGEVILVNYLSLLKKIQKPSYISKRQMLNKVPQVTIYFWTIKILATTVGETAADFLNIQLNIGLINTSLFMSVLLLLALFFQLREKQYIPKIYWLTVVLFSVVGTLITDNLTDNLGVPLVISTIVFFVALIVTFTIWYTNEKTLSIHSIYTTKREIFYWLSIFFTFALGTAAGDYLSEAINFGYLKSLFLFVFMIMIIFLAYYYFKMNSIVSFWIAYILTRPLGASFGDYLSQPADAGGLGLGVTITSIFFLIIILGLVIYLTETKADTICISKNKDK